MADQIVASASFHTAFFTGDLAAIEAYFTQPHVRSQVDSTNAYIAATEGDELDPATFELPDGSCPWFRRSRNDIPLVTAVRKGHVHIIEWFFSPGYTASMGPTLTCLLPLIAQSPIGHPTVLEIVLSSTVFRDLIDADTQQSILEDVLSRGQSPSLIQLAIAHGADVNNEVLASIARCCSVDCVGVLEDAGALLVGAEVFEEPSALSSEYQPSALSSEYQCVQAFLQRGVDWGTGASKLLIGAPPERIAEVLKFGFVDVDARDASGRTALMNAAWISSVTENHPIGIDVDNPAPRMAHELLRYCDINATDLNGCTALHYAASSNSAVTRLLLEWGADPNARDHDGHAAFDDLWDFPFAMDNWSELLVLFLECGADPFFAPAVDTTLESVNEAPVSSMYDTLREDENRRDFLDRHPEYFTLHRHDDQDETL